jgi:tetratricopeptide (TPR) repeat protein
MEITEFLNRGWRDHAGHAEVVADRLPEGLSLITGPGQAGRLAGLVVHVLGEHLGRWQDGVRLIRAIAALPVAAAPSDQRALLRSLATLQYCAGRTADFEDSLRRAAPGGVAEDTDRVSALAVAAAALVGQGRVDEAQAAFDAALSHASAPPLSVARTLAITGNNLSWDLEEKDDRTGPEAVMMIRAARIARQYWGIAGGWLEVGRAEHRLSRSLSADGRGALALAHAEACLRICEENSAAPMERFFAHEAISRAHHAAGNGDRARAARDTAAGILEHIDPEQREHCTESLAALDVVLTT